MANKARLTGKAKFKGFFKNHWIRIIVGLGFLLFFALLTPVAYYVSFLDWDYSHQQETAALPFYDTLAPKGAQPDGLYRIQTDKYEYRARLAGMDNDGPGLILLHGFPSTSVIWQALLKPAAEAGYRVVAFDQRGYSPGARPFGVDAYKINTLASDVFDVADAVGFNKFHLTGHDWGAVVGWYSVLNYPERIKSWTAHAIPHYAVFMHAVVTDPDQMIRSSYIERLRKPFIPEFFMGVKDQAYLRKMLASIPKADLNEYLKAFAEPYATTSILNWYRALDPNGVLVKAQKDMKVTVPTLFMWGTSDGVVAESAVELARSLMPDDYTEHSYKAGHALIRDVGDEIIPLMIDFWKRQDTLNAAD